MIHKGRREKLCFSPGPFFSARGILLFKIIFALILFPAFLASALAAAEPFDETVLAEVQALQELKEKQPEAYQQRVNELKENLKKDVGSWRTQKPEVYQRFMQRGQQRSKQHREFLRQKRPNLYPEFQRRHEKRENNREAQGSVTPSREKQLRTPRPAARQAREDRRLSSTPQNPQSSQRQPQASANQGFAQHPRRAAGNGSRAERKVIRRENRPGSGHGHPRQQRSTIHSQEQYRKGPSNSQGVSAPSRPEQRPRPRDSRQRV